MSNIALRVSPLILACPVCAASLKLEEDGTLRCADCAQIYPVVDGRGVLIRPENDLFSIDDYVSAKPKIYGRSRWARYLPKITADLAAARVLPRLREQLDARGKSRILVVGGGCQRGWLDQRLRDLVDHEIVYTDVDTASDVELFCDGHDLPFKGETFDALVTTAVLEHVFYPERVAEEIARVLKPDGLLYSEVPFMQQVHEGAYDFTRYTLSGHRRLFNQFKEIDSGMTAGPGSALAWSIESFILAFARSQPLRLVLTGLCRIICGPLKYFDHFLVKRAAAMDGACGTYFFGQKAEIARRDSEIISAYIGSKHLSHT
jgi:SAM-dependent methyltransferase